MLDLPNISMTRSSSCHKTDSSIPCSTNKLESQKHKKLHESVIIEKNPIIKKPKFWTSEHKIAGKRGRFNTEDNKINSLGIVLEQSKLTFFII